MNSPANWQTELAQAFKDSATLSQFLDWPVAELAQYPLLVPKELAQMIKLQGPDGVLARQFLTHTDENSELGVLDPIGDVAHQKTAQLIHRYHNRALLIPTTRCPVNCRYCFRKNELQDDIFANDRERTLQYLLEHTEIEEVIFTGGDPLILSDEKLAGWLEALAQIPHLRFVRFHSRVPVILPSRLTSELQAMLKSFQPRFEIVMVVHTNHPSEWSAQALAATSNFSSFTWLSQSVLLKGVNDSAEELIELFRFLSQHKIRPYYLHHPDQTRGAMHFGLSLEAGRRIWASLHHRLPGWMLPQYVVDLPQGPGKVQAFNPENFEFSGLLIDRLGFQRPVPPTYLL